jgi:hypothetical protein
MDCPETLVSPGIVFDLITPTYLAYSIGRANVAHHPPQITLNSQQKTSGGRVHGRDYAAFSDDFNSKSCIAIQNGKVII